MEVTQRLQPTQHEACKIFTEIEGRVAEPEQVVTAAEKNLEGPINEVVIQEFVEHEVVVQQWVEAARAKLEDFEVELPKPK
jgi:hypothetical protein